MALEKVSKFSFPWNTEAGGGHVYYPLGTEWSFKIMPPDADPTRQDVLRFFDGQNYYDISTETNYTADEVANGRTITVTVPVELVNAALSYDDLVKPEICCSSWVNGNFAGTRYEYVLFAFPVGWDITPLCNVQCVDTSGCYDRYGKFLYGVSSINITATPTAQYGATVVSCKIRANGKTQAFENPTGACRFEAGAVQVKNSVAIQVTVVDSRGEKSTFNLPSGVLDYAPPAITKLNAERCDADGTTNRTGNYLKVTFSSAVTHLTGSATSDKNTAKYELKYKKQTATSFTSASLTSYSNVYAVTNGVHIFEADSASTYDVQLYVTDNHRTTSLSTTARTATMRMHLKRGVNGIGFGKTAELDGVLDIGWKTRFHGGILPMRLADNIDLNSVTTYGIYDSGRDGSKYANNPFGDKIFLLEVMEDRNRNVNSQTGEYNLRSVVQRAFYVTDDAEMYIARRTHRAAYVKYDTSTLPYTPIDVPAKWTEWEWENPPMLAGVTYRTTERFNGKTVYCIALEGTASTGDNNIWTPPDAGSELVSIAGQVNGYPVPSVVDGASIQYKANSAKKILINCSAASVAGSYRFIVKFTK